jgi:hypothetical protein
MKDVLSYLDNPRSTASWAIARLAYERYNKSETRSGGVFAINQRITKYTMRPTANAVSMLQPFQPAGEEYVIDTVLGT